MRRQTKAKKEAAQKAALLRRVSDVYSGAIGYAWDSNENFAVADTLCRVLPALQTLFSKQWKDYMHATGNLNNYDTADSATEFLYSHGVRAQ